MTTPGVGSANADDCVCTALHGIDFGSSLGEPNDGFLHDVLASDTYGLHSITLFSRFDEDIQQVASIGPPGNNRQAGVVRVKEPVERGYPDFQMKRIQRVDGLTADIFTSKHQSSCKYGCGTYVVQTYSNYTLSEDLQDVFPESGNKHYGHNSNNNQLPFYHEGSFLPQDFQHQSNTDDNDYTGYWISVKYPIAFIPTAIEFISLDTDDTQFAYDSLPGLFKVFGRNADSDMWITIHEKTDKLMNTASKILFDNDHSYNQLYVVMHSLQGEDSQVLGFKNFDIYGLAVKPRLVTSSGGNDDGGGVDGVVSLYGDADAQLSWENILPEKFSICWVSRYSNAYEQNRILKDTETGVYGHEKNENPGFVKGGSGEPIIVAGVDATKYPLQWLVQCFNNVESTSMVDQTFMSPSNEWEWEGYQSAERKLTINEPLGSEFEYMGSAFNIHSVYVWNQAARFSTVNMTRATEALRREVGGIPYGAHSAVVSIPSPHMYHDRIAAVVSPLEEKGWVCAFIYPPEGPVRSPYNTDGDFLYDATSSSTAYATGSYITTNSSELTSTGSGVASFLLDTDTATSVSFKHKNYRNNGNSDRCEYDGSLCLGLDCNNARMGDWIAMTAPVQFRLVGYEIVGDTTTSGEDDYSPAVSVIYGRNGLEEWKELFISYSGTGKVLINCKTGPCKDTFSSYAMLVPTLINCQNAEEGALSFHRLKFWGMPCEAGRSLVGRSCLFCATGTYSNSWGQLGCRACPAGTTTMREGASNILECVPSAASLHLQASRCIPGHTPIRRPPCTS